MARPELPHIGIILVGAPHGAPPPRAGWWRKRKATNAAPTHTVFYLVVAYTWLLWKCWLDCAPCFVKHKYLTNVYTWNLQNCPGWKTHFFKRLTPQEDKWVQDVQVHTCLATCNPFHNLHKLKHKVNRYVFSSGASRHTKKITAKKDTTGGDATWPNYT